MIPAAHRLPDLIHLGSHQRRSGSHQRSASKRLLWSSVQRIDRRAESDQLDLKQQKGAEKDRQRVAEETGEFPDLLHRIQGTFSGVDSDARNAAACESRS